MELRSVLSLTFIAFSVLVLINSRLVPQRSQTTTMMHLNRLTRNAWQSRPALPTLVTTGKLYPISLAVTRPAHESFRKTFGSSGAASITSG